MANAFRFSSEEGMKLCRELSQPELKFMPHDYSLIIATNIMDGIDCLFRSACGSGKTGILALIALCIVKIGAKNSLVPTKAPLIIPDIPVILVICPTDALEMDLERKLKSYSIKATAINSDLCAKASHDHEQDLWVTAKSSNVILLAPEQLEGDGLARALNDASFL
ncbi:hypothetical protein HHX47_DHR6000571 [Lentinula edodes]|nr:hypothetical protein HHX47_DHR6000571 [Lentinula edodes]